MGTEHPLSLLQNEAYKVLTDLGFEIAMGPELETEWYNFDALNVPKDHPARDMQDTFYLEGGNFPRTHTSGMQIRYLEAHKDDLPARIIAPGKVYRNEDEDARHSWSFFQIEGLDQEVIGPHVEHGHPVADAAACRNDDCARSALCALKPL